MSIALKPDFLAKPMKTTNNKRAETKEARKSLGFADMVFAAKAFVAVVLAPVVTGLVPSAYAQFQIPLSHVSPQGYSGGPMTPSASVLGQGQLAIAHDRQLPGAPVPAGYNYQVGFGLFPGFEFIGRLATNDLGCNMFVQSACPSGTIRDFSASMKWQLPLPWAEDKGPRLAVGATDLGGAATYFRSYYAVVSQQWRNFDLSLGKAQAQVPNAPLQGWFGSLSYRPFAWAQFAAEHIDGRQWVSAKLLPAQLDASAPTWLSNLSPYVVYTRSLQDSSLTERQWIGFGIQVPLDFSGVNSQRVQAAASASVRTIKPIDLATFAEALESRGFYGAKWGRTSSHIVLRVDQSAYPWNTLDAAGNALGVLLAAFHEGNEPFRLEVTQQGVVVAVLSGDLACARLLMQEGSWCTQGESLRFIDPRASDPQLVSWRLEGSWFRRPEVVLSPAVTTALGTEFGALDVDSAINLNALIPLWPGAYYDWNRTMPTGLIRSEDFDMGRPFYYSRFVTATNRKMLHQLLPLPIGQSYARASTGYIYSVWKGWQLEALSYFQDGQHRVGLTTGRFQYDPLPHQVPARDPKLWSWRYAPKQVPWYHAELQSGQFWGGDEGYVLTQRFWHGDTALALYLRRTKMAPQEPLVSFAGFQIQLPLTPRSNTGFSHLAVRGTSQWSYAVESKILEKDNRITPGFGVIPRAGDSLAQWLNRDRIGLAYLNGSLQRLRNAYWSLEP